MWFFTLVRSPLFRYVIGAIVIIAFIGGIYFFGYINGSNDKDAEYQVVIKEERSRIAEINKAVLAKAIQREAKLKTLLELRDEQLQELAKAALEDPNAGNFSITLDSVLRINRAGRTTRACGPPFDDRSAMSRAC